MSIAILLKGIFVMAGVPVVLVAGIGVMSPGICGMPYSGS